MFDEADLDDRELPDESDMDNGDGSIDTEPCPNCGKIIFEGASLCPHCRQFIPAEPSRGVPLWMVIGAIVCLVAVLFVWLR